MNIPLSAAAGLTGISADIQGIQISLKYKYGCDLIDIFLSVFAPDTALDQCALCFHGGKPLVPHDDLKTCPPCQHVPEFERLLCTLPYIIIHVLWKPQYDLLYFIFPDQSFNARTCAPEFVLLFSLYRLYSLCCESQWITDRNAHCL